MSDRDPFLVRRTRLVLLDLVDRAVHAGTARVLCATMPELDRRAFLRTLARTSASTLAAAYGASLLAACGSSGPEGAQRLVRSVDRRNELVERWLFRHTAMDHARAGWRDAGSGFPSYHVAPAVPVWDAARLGPWSLAITGLVARPQRLALADLARLPHITQRVEHFCVEGWNAVASWTGVRLRDLAALVGAAPSARYVDFRSFDVEHPGAPVADAKSNPATPVVASHPAGEGSPGPTLADLGARRDYHESWDIESALHPQTLIAYGMDGHWLGPAHGAPARLHSPVKLGYKNTKYLTQVVFMRERNGGYWSDQGYEWYGGT